MSTTAAWTRIIYEQKEVARRAGDSFSLRRDRLRRLRQMILDRESEILAALSADLGKSAVEAYASEVGVVLNEIEYLLTNMKRTLRDRTLRRRFGERSILRHRPFGSILILGPWNYPFSLTLIPLAGALAAGNSCFLKPSELASNTADLLADLLGDLFEQQVVNVVQGDAAVAEMLLSLPWDFIFFTGSERIGQKVALAAAKQLIPSVLELGGKCPCILDESGVNEESARRIIWGKMFNAGQTCVAPDYLLVPKDSQERFVSLLSAQIDQLYGPDLRDSPDYGRIINHKQMERLADLAKDGQIRYGGSIDRDQRYFEPVILTDIPADSRILKEEIFGPILPVIPYENWDQLIETLNVCPDPLAIYVFTKTPALLNRLKSEGRCGTLCVNQVVRHAGRSDLPFGGIGHSGYGRYHGRSSLKTFSYEQVISRYRPGKSLRGQYPPYGNGHFNAVKLLRKILS